MKSLAYSNSDNLFPKTDFVASGALGGSLAGLQTMYGLNSLNDQVRLSDINNRMEELKLEEAQKNVPLQDLTRQAKTLGVEADIATDPMLRRDSVDAEYKKQGIVNRNAVLEGDAKEKILRATTVNQELTPFFDEKGQPNMGDLEMQGLYPQLKSTLEKAGVKGLPAVYNKDTARILNLHKNAAVQSLSHLAEMEKTRLTGDQAMQRTKAQIDAQKEIQAGHDAVRKNIIGSKPKGDAAIEQDIRTKLKDGDGILDENTLTQAATLVSHMRVKDRQVDLEKAYDRVDFEWNMSSTKEKKLEMLKKYGLEEKDLDRPYLDIRKEIIESSWNRSIMKEAIERFANDAKIIAPEVAKIATIVGANIGNKPIAGETKTPSPNQPQDDTSNNLSNDPVVKQAIKDFIKDNPRISPKMAEGLVIERLKARGYKPKTNIPNKPLPAITDYIPPIPTNFGVKSTPEDPDAWKSTGMVPPSQQFGSMGDKSYWAFPK